MANFEVIMLGTSTSMPTKFRSHPAIYIRYLNNRFLFDCGEGTQRQLIFANVSPFKINAIFISHLHGDHCLGLGGIIHSLSFLGREEPLLIFGPRGIGKIVNFFANWPYLDRQYDIVVKEVKEGVVFENQDVIVKAKRVKHSCPAFAYLIEEKVGVNLDKEKLKRLGLYNNPLCKKLKKEGEIEWKGKKIKLEDVALPSRKPTKIGYTGDCVYDESLSEFFNGCDLIIAEATFAEKERERAHDYFHMTAKEAAKIALKANAKKLVLTHISPRYDSDPKSIEKEARAVFKESTVAQDLMTFIV